MEFLPEDTALPALDDAEQDILSGERARILRECMERVEPEAREALWLVYVENLSYEQAAAVMKTTAKKLDYRISKGKRLLRTELKKEGITDAHG